MSPVHMVYTFQLASRRAGVFVWFRVSLPGAKLSLACQEGQSHKLYAPSQASHGRAAPNWLGAAQLKAGGSCPMKLRWLLPLLNEAPGAPPYANRSKLMTGKLPRPGVVPESCDAAGVSSPGLLKVI